jgi:hypothetical protein
MPITKATPNVLSPISTSNTPNSIVLRDSSGGFGAGTITGSTIENGIFTNGYTEEASSSTISTTTYTIDLANGTVQLLTLSNASITFTFPTSTAGRSFFLTLKQDATGGRVVTWPASVKWAGGTTPTITATASKSDVFSFVCVDGTSWVGIVVGQNYTI